MLPQPAAIDLYEELSVENTSAQHRERFLPAGALLTRRLNLQPGPRVPAGFVGIILQSRPGSYPPGRLRLGFRGFAEGLTLNPAAPEATTRWALVEEYRHDYDASIRNYQQAGAGPSTAKLRPSSSWHSGKNRTRSRAGTARVPRDSGDRQEGAFWISEIPGTSTQRFADVCNREASPAWR